MTAGRPTDYGPRILKLTRDYIKNFASKYGDVVPTVAGLAVALDVGRQTIYDWASQEDKKEFAYTLETILSTQEKELISKSLTGTFNTTISKLMLANHGYREKTDVTSGGKPIPILGNVSINDSNEEDNETD